MKKYANEYLKYLQENHLFIFKNYNTIIQLARNIFKQVDDDTYYWMINNKNQYKKTNLTPSIILDVSHAFFSEISEDLGKQFLDDVNNNKIKFTNSKEQQTSVFSAVRDSETRKLKDFEINIKYTGTVNNIFEIIHEYTHKLVEKINQPINRDKTFVDSCDEGAAIYAELLLLDKLNKMGFVKSDLKIQIGNRISTVINGPLELYETLLLIQYITSGLSEEVIKSKYQEKNPYLYDLICNKIKEKNGGKECCHFLGTMIAINTYFKSVNKIEDFKQILNEATNSKYQLLESKLPNDSQEISKFLIDLRKSLSDNEQKVPTIKKYD